MFLKHRNAQKWVNGFGLMCVTDRELPKPALKFVEDPSNDHQEQGSGQAATGVCCRVGGASGVSPPQIRTGRMGAHTLMNPSLSRCRTH